MQRLWPSLAGRGVEVIVADGGSSDDTVGIARHLGARIVSSRRGRGIQLNEGARVAAKKRLFFLHADTIPPPTWVDDLSEVLARRGVVAGAFRLKIQGRGPSLRTIAALANVRSRCFRMPYGDQGLFLEAETFRHVGGFPDQALLEDVALVAKLRRRGRVAIARSHVETSGRRWQSKGPWRTTLHHQICLAAWRLGVSPETIARWRESRSDRK